MAFDWKAFLRPFKIVWKYSLAIIFIYLAIVGGSILMDAFASPRFIMDKFGNGINFGLQSIFYTTILFYAYVGFEESRKSLKIIESVKLSIYVAASAFFIVMGAGYVMMLRGPVCSSGGNCTNFLALFILFTAIYFIIVIFSSLIGAFIASKLAPFMKKK